MSCDALCPNERLHPERQHGHAWPRGEICSNSDMYAGRPDCSTSWMTEAFRHHANAEWDDSET